MIWLFCLMSFNYWDVRFWISSEKRLGNATELWGSRQCGILDAVYYMWLWAFDCVEGCLDSLFVRLCLHFLNGIKGLFWLIGLITENSVEFFRLGLLIMVILVGISNWILSLLAYLGGKSLRIVVDIGCGAFWPRALELNWNFLVFPMKTFRVQTQYPPL